VILCVTLKKKETQRKSWYDNLASAGGASTWFLSRLSYEQERDAAKRTEWIEKGYPVPSVIPLMFWEVDKKMFEHKKVMTLKTIYFSYKENVDRYTVEHIREFPWHKLTGLTTDSFAPPTVPAPKPRRAREEDEQRQSEPADASEPAPEVDQLTGLTTAAPWWKPSLGTVVKTAAVLLGVLAFYCFCGGATAVLSGPDLV